MSALVGPGRAGAAWITLPRPRTQGVRLFCLPYAGGGVSAFRGWAEGLPQAEVAPIQLPGRESRIGESPVVDVEELADAVLPYTDRPYAVFGHSFGARLGFELCRRLRARRAPAPVWLFASGCHAPHLPPLHPPASVLGDEELVDRLTTLGGSPPEVLAHPELRALALPSLRADLAYIDRYVYEPAPPLECPITVFGGDQDTETRVDDLFAWGGHTAGAFAVRVLPGDHFFLHSARRQLLASLASDLATGRAATSRVTVPVLEPGEVHVWYARTDELALDDHVLRQALSDEELARAEAFRFPRDAVRYVRRRWLLRRLLAAYGSDPGTRPLPVGPNGKPSVVVGGGGALTFSASSSAGLAVVALARGQDLGLDVERSREVPDLDVLARATMADHELDGLQRVPPGRRTNAFLRLWTVKEAFVKGVGAGLSLDPAKVLTTPAGPGQWRVVTAEDAAIPPWSVSSVDVGPQHVASLAVKGESPARIRVLALTPGRLS